MAKLVLDTRGVEYTVTKCAEPKADQNGRQKFTKDGQPIWQTQVQALDESGAEILMISTAGVQPELSVRQVVVPVGLEAIPWNTGGPNSKSGILYRAEELRPVSKPTAVAK